MTEEGQEGNDRGQGTVGAFVAVSPSSAWLRHGVDAGGEQCATGSANSLSGWFGPCHCLRLRKNLGKGDYYADSL